MLNPSEARVKYLWSNTYQGLIRGISNSYII